MGQSEVGGRYAKKRKYKHQSTFCLGIIGVKKCVKLKLLKIEHDTPTVNKKLAPHILYSAAVLARLVGGVRGFGDNAISFGVSCKKGPKLTSNAHIFHEKFRRLIYLD